MSLTYTVVITSITDVEIASYSNNDDVISSIVITNNKTNTHSVGELILTDEDLDLKIGMTVEITINGESVFTGFISDVSLLSIGKKQYNLKLTGLDILLYRDSVVVGG